ncbi:MAG: hypothetical protein ACR2I9_00335, partial [Candidatus Nanopelagicaceae bacterium]
ATPSNSPSARPTYSLRPTPNPTASAIQVHPTRPPAGPRLVLPTPTPSVQPIGSQSPTPRPSTSPAPTPTQSTTPTAEPSPTNSNEPPVVLPTPPKVDDPKNVVYVDPEKPTVITPEELPSPPKGPIEIVTPPKFGVVEISPTNEITYTSNLADPKSTVVDVVVLQYTNLSGATVVVRKEFVLTQKGDVPRIIQTGYESSTGLNLSYLVVTILLTLTIFRRRSGNRS